MVRRSAWYRLSISSCWFDGSSAMNSSIVRGMGLLSLNGAVRYRCKACLALEAGPAQRRRWSAEVWEARSQRSIRQLRRGTQARKLRN